MVFSVQSEFLPEPEVSSILSIIRRSEGWTRKSYGFRARYELTPVPNLGPCEILFLRGSEDRSLISLHSGPFLVIRGSVEVVSEQRTFTAKARDFVQVDEEFRFRLNSRPVVIIMTVGPDPLSSLRISPPLPVYEPAYLNGFTYQQAAYPVPVVGTYLEDLEIVPNGDFLRIGSLDMFLRDFFPLMDQSGFPSLLQVRRFLDLQPWLC
jgi:hypothetical protein